jgi:hypothetical protein
MVFVVSSIAIVVVVFIAADTFVLVFVVAAVCCRFVPLAIS